MALGSAVAWITFALNLFIGLFMTAYFWLTITVLGPWNEQRDRRFYGPLITIWALVVLWVPCRMYADWYQNAYLRSSWYNVALFFLTLIALALLFYIVYFLIRDLFDLGWWPVLFGLLGLGGAVTSFVANPVLFEYVRGNLEAMPFILFVSLCVGMLLVFGGIAQDIITKRITPASSNEKAS